MIDIVIVNNCSALTDHAVMRAIPIFQAQINEDLRPCEGATLHFAGRGQPIPEEMLPVYLLDHYDNHHPSELPHNKLFVADAMCAGESWTEKMTHELVKMLGNFDPDTQLEEPATTDSATIERQD